MIDYICFAILMGCLIWQFIDTCRKMNESLEDLVSLRLSLQDIQLENPAPQNWRVRNFRRHYCEARRTNDLEV